MKSKRIGIGRLTILRSLVVLALVSLHATVFRPPIAADIFRWDDGELITEKDAEPGAQLRYLDLSYADLVDALLSDADLYDSDLTFAHLMGADLTDADFSYATLTATDFTGAVVRGAGLKDTTDRGFTKEQLYSTSSYQSGDLTGIRLLNNDLSGWDFAGKNLTDASFSGATLAAANLREANLTDADFNRASLSAADFTGANLTETNFAGTLVRHADFSDTTSRGFTAEQFYSTRSYWSGDLTRIGLGFNDLSGWDLASKNLTHADFGQATLTDADLRLSDLRGANITASQLASAASTTGTIGPNGEIKGLTLDSGERLRVRDYNGEPAISIRVESTMNVDPTAALTVVFEDDVWSSTISFQSDIAVSLDGSLELFFAKGTRPADLIDTTFNLFDWDDAMVTGMFGQIVTEAGAEWDTANLYTNGEVTLLSAKILRGDVNLDRSVNGLDVDPFVDVLVHGPYQPEADINEDGAVNGLDVDLFVTGPLVGGGAHQIPEPSTLLLCLVALGVVSGWRECVAEHHILR